MSGRRYSKQGNGYIPSFLKSLFSFPGPGTGPRGRGVNSATAVPADQLVIDARGRRAKHPRLVQDFSDRDWRRGQFPDHNNWWQAIAAGKDPREQLSML